MKIEEISDDKSYYLGMDDYKIILKQSNHILELKYINEARFGDSYHTLTVDGVLLDGLFWGCNFIFILEQRYMICSWMEKLYDRKTLIVNLATKGSYVMKMYSYDYKVDDNMLILGNDNYATSTTISTEKIRNLRFKPPVSVI